MAKKVVDEASIVSVADAIRKKGKTSDQLVFPQGFVNAIQEIPQSGGNGSSIQMASGTMPNYNHGELKIENLPFKPVVVIVAFNATGNKKESSTFFSVAINSNDFLNSSIGFGEFKESWSQFVWAATVKSNATFINNGVTFTPIVDNSGKISDVKWWAFGGFTI